MLAGGMRVVTRVCLGLCAAVGLACFAFVGQNTPTVLETDSGLDLANLYHEDVVRGDKIIQQMSDKVVSPVWNALTGDPRMRKVLAAALGAEKGGAGQVSLANLFRTGPESSPEANAQGAASRSSQVDVMRRSLASLANRPLHAGNLHLQMQSYRKGLEVKALGQVMGKGRQQLRQAPSFVYNVYAPGVISGKTVQSESVGSPKAAEQKKHDAATSESMHRPIKGKEKTTASQTSVKTSNPLVDDLKKATGFEDEYHHSDSIVGALERKVQALSRTEEAQSAMLQASKRAFMKNAKALNKQVLRGAVPTVRNAVIRMPHNNAKSKMSNFLGKLRSGAGETDKEVLKLLTHANVLRAIGEQIKGDHVQEGDSRLEVVHEMKRRYAERERKMREREVREAKKLQDSIDAENNIVFGIPEVGAHVSDEEHEQQVRREHQNASDEKHEDSEGMRSDAPHGQHEDKIRVRSNAIDKEHEDRERRKSRARGRSAIEGRGKDSSWRHTVEGDGWEDADISSRRGGVVTGQSRYSHSMAYAHRDKESSAFDDDWADKPSVRGEFQFRDEAVPASSATGRAVHRESENDGSGPVEMSRVRALGFSTPEQYERHKMESELQKERAQIASLRRTAEDERGGLKADMDVEKGLFSDYGHSMHSRAPVEPRGGSNTFAAGAEAERERELVGKVRRDLSEMESFMGDDAEQEVSKRPHTVVVRSRAIGHSGSVLPEIIREGLEEDVKDMGDTKVPVAGHPINLDII